MWIQGISENKMELFSNVLIVLLVLLVEFFKENTDFPLPNTNYSG